jgi:hypothetical protein
MDLVGEQMQEMHLTDTEMIALFAILLLDPSRLRNFNIKAIGAFGAVLTNPHQPGRKWAEFSLTAPSLAKGGKKFHNYLKICIKYLIPCPNFWERIQILVMEFEFPPKNLVMVCKFMQFFEYSMLTPP